MASLRTSTTTEKPLEASKWLQVQALLSKNELKELFDFIGSISDFHLYACGAVCPKNEGEIDKNNFLDIYGRYVESLMNGQLPDSTQYRPSLSSSMTASNDAFFTIPVGEDKQIIRICKPIVQLQAHDMDYSKTDKKFHPMVFGLDNIAWGLQFSYPQLYRNNETKQVEKTLSFPNAALFQGIQKWMRQYSIPTPFNAEGTSINVPMRLGKECLPWINRHPSLVKKNISVRI